MGQDTKDRCLILAVLFIFILMATNMMALGETYQLDQQIMDDERNDKIGTEMESQRYLLIKKEVIPNKQIYMPNEEITVFVEIRLLKYRSMDEKIKINISELIDNNLLLIRKPRKD